MIVSRSIRFRLTLWYLSVLFAGMVVFGAAVWGILGYVLFHGYERDLDEGLTAFEQFLDKESRGNSVSDLREEAREYSTGLPMEDSLRVWGPDGQLLYERTATPGQLLRKRRQVFARGIQLEAELSAPLQDYYRTLATLKWTLAGSLPLVLLVAGLGGWWLARRALAPVDAMTRQARSISLRDLSARLSVPMTEDELQRLADAWNELLQRVESSVNTATRFTTDAAHELRTPVAVIRTSAELALRYDPSKDGYREALFGIQGQAEHMTELLERLLLLAKGDIGQWELRFDGVLVSSLLKSVCQEITPLAVSKGIDIDWSWPKQELLVSADETALRQLVLILMDNALKFTPFGGRVVVSLSATESACVLEVSDTGCGIKSADLPHVFQRFFRADASRTSGGGSGLGLSIARTIIEAHRGTIDLSSSEGHGTVVLVTLPSLSSPQQDVFSSAVVHGL